MFGKVSLRDCALIGTSLTHAQATREDLHQPWKFLPKDRTAFNRMFDQSLVFSIV